MPTPKKASPGMTKLLADAGLSEIDLARGADKFMRQVNKGNHGPLPSEPEFDTYDLMVMNVPSPLDFEPCDRPCLDPACPCRYRPADEDP